MYCHIPLRYIYLSSNLLDHEFSTVAMQIASCEIRLRKQVQTIADKKLLQLNKDIGRREASLLDGCAEAFAADKMIGPVKKALMDMKVAELKGELEARGAPKTARDKAALRRRLSALLMSGAAGAPDARRGTGLPTRCS